MAFDRLDSVSHISGMTIDTWKKLTGMRQIASEHGFRAEVRHDCVVVYVPQSQDGVAIEDATFFVRSMRELYLALGY